MGSRSQSRSRSRSRSGSREGMDRMVTIEEAKEDDRVEDDAGDSIGKDRRRRYSSGNGSSRAGRSRSKSKSKSRSRSRSAEKRRNRSRSPRRSRRSPSRSRSRSYSPRRRDRSDYTFDGRDADDGYRLHVADLDSQASKRDLEKLFGKYGPLKEIWMARSVPCFAFVVYRHREDAEEAQRKVDGQEVCSRRVRVTIAKPRTRGRGRRGFDPGMRCYQCGERGHFSRDCSDTKFGYRRPPSPRRYRDDRYRDDRHDDRRDRRHRY